MKFYLCLVHKKRKEKKGKDFFFFFLKKMVLDVGRLLVCAGFQCLSFFDLFMRFLSIETDVPCVQEFFLHF